MYSSGSTNDCNGVYMIIKLVCYKTILPAIRQCVSTVYFWHVYWVQMTNFSDCFAFTFVRFPYSAVKKVIWYITRNKLNSVTTSPLSREHFNLKIFARDQIICISVLELKTCHSIQMKLELPSPFLQKSTRKCQASSKMYQIRKNRTTLKLQLY